MVLSNGFRLICRPYTPSLARETALNSCPLGTESSISSYSASAAPYVSVRAIDLLAIQIAEGAGRRTDIGGDGCPAALEFELV